MVPGDVFRTVPRARIGEGSTGDQTNEVPSGDLSARGRVEPLPGGPPEGTAGGMWPAV